jgi:hypothetical protein
MLRLATQRAGDRGLRATLLSVLEATLRVLQGGPRSPPRTDVGVEPLTLVRSLIRLVKELLSKEGTNRRVTIWKMRNITKTRQNYRRALIEMLIKYFAIGESSTSHVNLSPLTFCISACELVEGTFTEKKEAMIGKDVDWLWRAAYNLAIQGCTEWDNMAERASDLFDLSKQVGPSEQYFLVLH